MATSIPPHNLGEVIGALLALIGNPDITVDELMEHVPAPDFPTGGILYGLDGCATRTARARQRPDPRAGLHREGEEGGPGVDRRHRDPVPGEQVPPHRADGGAGQRNKEIEEISDLRDESDRDGMRVVVELKKDAVAEVVLNNLYKQTQMQTSFGVQLLAIVQNRPRTMNLKEFPRGIPRLPGRRSSPGGPCSCCGRRRPGAHPARAFDRPRPHRRGHPADPGLEGPEGGEGRPRGEVRPVGDPGPGDPRHAAAAADRAGAREDPAGAEGGARGDRAAEKDPRRGVGASARDRAGVPRDPGRLRRRPPPEIQRETKDLRLEDLIVDEEMVVTVSHTGYIKRNPISLYRTQRRGGAGRSAWGRRRRISSRCSSSPRCTPTSSSSRTRKVFWLKVHELPEAGRASKGRAIVNLLSLSPGEEIASILPVREFTEGKFVMTATSWGSSRRRTSWSTPRRARAASSPWG